ncbi:MAG: hypothetical protein AAFV45_12835 [Pseudomonadota bacterium]
MSGPSCLNGLPAKNSKRQGVVRCPSLRKVSTSALTWTLSLALALTPTLQSVAIAQARATSNNLQTAQRTANTANLSKDEYAACQSQSEEGFRQAIEAITLTGLQEGLGTVDYNAIVADEWRRADVDRILNQRVDIAVAEVRKQSSWGALLQSLAYQKQAQKLATEVAERVYRSDAMKTALEIMATGVGRQVGERIDYASADAADPAAQCVRAFLGNRYGSTVADAVTSDTTANLQGQEEQGGADVAPGSVLKQSGGGVAGVAILLIRRQLANLARSVGQRLVGSILARLVSVVAGGVGVVLIAKDIWDLRYGVLPIIANEMKAAGTKEKVREEIANAMKTQIEAQVGTIARQTADRVVEIWRNFKTAHAKALEFAERDTSFRSFLDGLRADELGRLDEVVSLTLAREGENGVFNRLSDGTLRQAVRQLPDTAMQIARETQSIDTALRWSTVAGSKLEEVVEFGIYKDARPQDFTSTSLNRVFALNDRVAITRMAQLKSAARESLFELDPDKLRGLARSLTVDELSTLASYLTGLDQAPRARVLNAVAAAPGKMQILASQRVRNAVVASADQSAAVEMMLRNQKLFDPAATWQDLQKGLDGQISPILVAEKHPLSIAAAIAALLVLLLMLRRLFAGPARKGRTSSAKSGTKDNKSGADDKTADNGKRAAIDPLNAG